MYSTTPEAATGNCAADREDSGPLRRAPSPSRRPYQEEALRDCGAALARGIRRQLCVLPTGAGKTIVAVDVVDTHGGEDALILSHTDETLEQARERVGQFAPHLMGRVGKVKAERDEVDAPIVLASVQTLSRPKRLARLLDARERPFEVVVVDEAHHAAAKTYGRVLKGVGALGRNGSGPLLYGITATADRGDGKGLGEVFEEIVTERTILDLIEADYLCDMRAVEVALQDADYRNLHTRAGDFIASEVETMLSDANAPEHVIEAYKEHAPGRKALLFTPTVRSAYDMVESFVVAGIPAEGLDGTTPADQRAAVLGRLKTGETKVVANCAVLTEGFDEPSVDCIIVARPTKARGLYQQMVGRGTRKHPGKEDCLILDLVGAASRHDLMTAASLFGVDKGEMAGEGLLRAVASGRAREKEAAQAGVLVARTVELFERRTLHWIKISNAGEQFAISCGEDKMLALTKYGERWDAELFEGGAHVRDLASHEDLAYVQGIAEEYVRERGAGALVNANARWRRQPASPKQLNALRKWKCPARPGLTKGEASDMLAVVIGMRGNRRGA